MTSEIFNAIGGLGVFLLGMIVMTDGLKAITGNALRSALARFTKSPTSGAITGAISTAILQSSSATTVTAVGFVGAGLITFTQALGIIFGANIGTTITGWLVAIVGFKLKIGTLALPFILVGVLMHLFLRGRWSALGLTLAGFGLIFVGIGLIQDGMAGLQGVVTPDTFPSNNFGGRLLLLLIGIAITLVTQSSSAGIATALAAVHAGTISFEQAAIMVVGMDVGTTATAALATIGGSNDVRRTGFAHVIYNMLTGVMAFFLVTPYAWAASNLFPTGFAENPEIALVGFHTFFNALGVIAVLPFASSFARLMTWLVPDRPIKYTQRLDRSFYKSPSVALEAAQNTLKELANVVFGQLKEILTHGQSDEIQDRLVEANEALKKTRDFITPIDTSGMHGDLYEPKLAAIHTIDHLRRLVERCQEKNRSQRTGEPGIRTLGNTLRDAVEQAHIQTSAMINSSALDSPQAATTSEELERAWHDLAQQAETNRQTLIADTAAGREDTDTTIRKLDTIRWIRRVSYHVWRIVHYLSGGQNGERSPDLPEIEPNHDSPADDSSE